LRAPSNSEVYADSVKPIRGGLPLRAGVTVALVFLASATTLAVTGWAAAAKTTRISVRSSGAQVKGASEYPAISADGRFVAFYSRAPRIVKGDTNGVADIFLHNRVTGRTRRVSVSSAGAQANGPSIDSPPAISANGRFVAFWSAATNLVRGDSNGVSDVFVRDRKTRTTSRVSVSSDGTQGNSYSGTPAISANGRFVAFWSIASNLVKGDTNDTGDEDNGDVFVHDQRSGKTTRVSVSSEGVEGNTESAEPSISANGRFVAFSSRATNLVSHDTNGVGGWDTFVRDRRKHTTRRVSVSSAGTQANAYSFGPSISADGRSIAFFSAASNLVAHDTNGDEDVFVHDRGTGRTRRVSVSSTGAQADNPSIASESRNAAISPGGRFVAFYSSATNLVQRTTHRVPGDIYVHDRRTGRTRLVSVSSSGTPGNRYSSWAAISAAGRFVAFDSIASNLVKGDTNNRVDVFVRGPLRSAKRPKP
jgi:Tol biopolymer transport system component